MSKINLGFLEVDLNEFVNAIKGISRGDLDNESKNSLTKMIEGVQKIYDMIVESLPPFYKIVQSDDSTFVTEFTSQFVIFKQMYYTNTGEMHVYCSIIRNNLKELLKRRNWLSKLPRLKDSLQKLDSLAEKWETTRMDFEIQLKSFLYTINERLSKIDELNRTSSVKESRSLLSALLRETDQSIMSIKTRLDELNIISAELL